MFSQSCPHPRPRALFPLALPLAIAWGRPPLIELAEDGLLVRIVEARYLQPGVFFCFCSRRGCKIRISMSGGIGNEICGKKERRGVVDLLRDTLPKRDLPRPIPHILFVRLQPYPRPLSRTPLPGTRARLPRATLRMRDELYGDLILRQHADDVLLHAAQERGLLVGERREGGVVFVWIFGVCSWV